MVDVRSVAGGMQCTSMAMSERLRGTVLEGTGGVWRVHLESGDIVEASLRGRLKKSDYGRREGGAIRRDTVDAAARTLKLAIGDNVALEGSDDGGWVIAEIGARRSQLARRAPGGGWGERVVAANVDQVVIVFAAARPEPHPRMLDRFLVIAEANELAPRIVVNKLDLAEEPVVQARFADYERAGYPVHFTSVSRRVGLASLHEALAGRRSVLTGPSGVGKSSLLNALFPGLELRVGEISESVNKGRHTTVGGYAHPLPGGGYVIDTPGLREVGMWALPPEHVDRFFPELRPYVEQCRFNDCTHIAEPDCAVRAAVARGDVSGARFESYRKLRDELEEAPEMW